MLHGQIGPKLYRCPKCDNVTQSHRGEWPSKSRQERRQYVISSAWFTVLMTLLGTLAAFQGHRYFLGDAPEDIWVFTAAGVVAMTTALWQGGRVFFSLQRDGNGYIDPRPVSFWSAESNMLWSLLVPFVAVAAILAITSKYSF